MKKQKKHIKITVLLSLQKEVYKLCKDYILFFRKACQRPEDSLILSEILQRSEYNLMRNPKNNFFTLDKQKLISENKEARKYYNENDALLYDIIDFLSVQNGFLIRDMKKIYTISKYIYGINSLVVKCINIYCAIIKSKMMGKVLNNLNKLDEMKSRQMNNSTYLRESYLLPKSDYNKYQLMIQTIDELPKFGQ